MSQGFVFVDVPLSSNSGGEPEVARGLTEVFSSPLSGPQPNPIVVDFLSPKLRHRTRGGTNSELIVKAVGVKPNERTGVLVFDFTAGLGTDAFLLAAAGYKVVAFERDPRIFELLQDGLRRLKASSLGIPQFDLEFRCADATEVVARESMRPEFLFPTAVIIDPMFESESTETKSLPRKEMALLRKMLPTSSKEEVRNLFQVAASVARSRVVVKRPMGSGEIVEPVDWGPALKPRRLEGKTAAFDIYSCRS